MKDKLKEYKEQLEKEIQAWSKLKADGQYQLGQYEGLKRAKRLLDEVMKQHP